MDDTAEKSSTLPPAGNMYPSALDQQAYPPPYATYPAQPAMVGHPQQYPSQQQMPMQPMAMQPMAMQPMMQQSSANINTNTNVADVKVNVVAPTTVTESARSYGTTAMIFGIGLSVFYCLFGCWHGLLCSLLAIYFAFSASSARDNEEGRKYNQWSVRCSCISIVVIVGLDVLAIIIGVAVTVASAAGTAATISSSASSY